MPVELLETTGTNYTDALTLGPSQQIELITYTISNPYAASYNLAKLDKAGSPVWDTTDLTALGGEQGSWACYGVRFKSFDPANPTIVKATAVFAGDPTPQGFTPSGQNFNSNGVSTSGIEVTGLVNANGTIAAGSGFTVVRNSAGNYTISFTPPSPFQNIPGILVEIQDQNTAANPTSVNNVSVNGFQVNTASGNDHKFYFRADNIQ